MVLKRSFNFSTSVNRNILRLCAVSVLCRCVVNLLLLLTLAVTQYSLELYSLDFACAPFCEA